MSRTSSNSCPPPGSRPSLFSTPEWFDVWAVAFGGDQFGLWRKAGDASTAIVPYVRGHEVIGGVSIAVARSAQNFHSPSYDVIGDRGCRLDFDAMLADLDVAFAAFHDVSDDSTLWSALSHFDQGRAQIEPMESAPYVDCTLDWAEYWAGRSKNLRANCETSRKRLSTSTVDIVTLRSTAEILDARDLVYEIEASGWKGQRGSAIAQSEPTRVFYDRLLRDFSCKDLLRLFLLKIDGLAIAFELCTLYGGVLSGLKCGYRESHAKVSPGQYLRYRFLQSAFGDPDVDLYNMLGPASAMKLRWATGTENLMSLRVFRSSPAGWLARTRFVTLRRVKEVLRRQPLAPCAEA